MILVGQFDSPFVRRVAVTLNHYHMPYERNTMSVFRNAEEMQKINPLIRVPSLILETGETLIDSSAIIDYLDEMAGPARALTPPHGPERRKVNQPVVLALGATEKAVALFFERMFYGERINRDYEARMLSQIRATLERLEHDCGAPWFDDEKLTQADVTTGCMVYYMKMRVADVFPADRYPKLHALALHCETKEDFVKARPSPEEVGNTAKGQA
jgi:glutathione S-transferase